MGGLFSRKKTPPSKITEQDKAIVSLKSQRDRLKRYQKKTNATLDKERQVARELLQQGKKDKAKSLLKKKRYQENLLQKTDDQLNALEKMVNDIEFATVQIKVVEGLKQGNESLNQLHKVMTIEDVERIMDETKEAVEYQREIDELISGAFTQEDEDDILAELKALTEDVELPSVPDKELEPPVRLPDVPTQEPERVKSKEKQREAVLAS